jgi:hypothetical protein
MTSNDQQSYPQSDRVRLTSQDRDTIREFLEWAHREHGAFLAQVAEGSSRPVHLVHSTEDLLEQHFEIDPVALEAERRHMLAAFAELRDKQEPESSS